MNLKLSFHGGAGTVTGSKYLLETGRERLLIDCGMFQGVKELRLANWRPPAFRPSDVQAVLLTHAHIDHSGYLPRLVRQGFHGSIYCTPATKELAEVLLLDAAKLQEEDAAYANRKGFSKHHPALPLFTEADAVHAVRRMKAVPYDRWLDVGQHVKARFHNAGHIIGSAFIEARVEFAERKQTLVFSGDLGRYGAALHADPAPRPPCDVLVLESTYGDRLHDDRPLVDQVRGPFRAALARGGTILIPAFAVARVQLLALLLRELMDAGDLPDVPIHIDSPMAVEATNIYRRYVDSGELDPDLAGDGWARAFPKTIHFHDTVEESRKLNKLPGGRIIISPSGMMTGGRVLHHLRRLLPDEKNLVVLSGFQAPGTRGRLVQEGVPTLRMHGTEVPVRAETLSITGLSAHADADELMRWVRSGASVPPLVFLTHGEPPAAAAMAARLERELHVQARMPVLGDVVDLSQPATP